ncbi:ecto-ADP-ribosyltransferase 5-like [Mastacembelus armatus]|uniref:ecto-ADP-ribosyltransferase 5-like n=1 Tax=Mastacembelus armatus TaxID=205130 RepID=UPI000E463691|nr:ecto-ADP-ribosyltransferase 5-like [Mastacembelus armatus]
MGNIFNNIFNKLKKIKGISLNMAEDSVDDMYFGCSEAMMEKVMNHEIVRITSQQFASDMQRENVALTREHQEAICNYTSNTIYKKFNDAVRNDGKNYPSSFQFNTLHFLLTSAIQILNNNNTCYTAYRRTKDRFEGHVNNVIRFGSFASSSLNTTQGLFGHETCFEIKTCSGAYLKPYSCIPSEEEVLIPPYEIFKITKKVMGKNKIEGLHDCKRVYILETAGIKSTLNCKAVRR